MVASYLGDGLGATASTISISLLNRGRRSGKINKELGHGIFSTSKNYNHSLNAGNRGLLEWTRGTREAPNRPRDRDRDNDRGRYETSGVAMEKTVIPPPPIIF